MADLFGYFDWAGQDSKRKFVVDRWMRLQSSKNAKVSNEFWIDTLMDLEICEPEGIEIICILIIHVFAAFQYLYLTGHQL